MGTGGPRRIACLPLPMQAPCLARFRLLVNTLAVLHDDKPPQAATPATARRPSSIRLPARTMAEHPHCGLRLDIWVALGRVRANTERFVAPLTAWMGPRCQCATATTADDLAISSAWVAEIDQQTTQDGGGIDRDAMSAFQALGLARQLCMDSTAACLVPEHLPCPFWLQQ